MKIGLIGLGRMGLAIAHRLLHANHEVFGYDPSSHAAEELNKKGGSACRDLATLVDHVRIFWLMVPAGNPVDAVLKELKPYLKPGDIIVDGGNSKFTDSIQRAEMLASQNIFFIDCGTSGGLRGQDIGFSLMVGGDRRAYDKVEPLLQAIAAPNGFGYMGKSGAGHYVKMVHNGIEYALMQSYAEGFHLLKDGHFDDLDLSKITSVWQNGSVIRSWLVELSHEIFVDDQELKKVSGEVAQTGMGKWTVEDAHEHDIPVTLIEDALKIRTWSEKTGGNYATKVVALLRNKFGGHSFKKRESK